ncbi:MAG: metalloregulator ArsR/SmtB family transcription factor [Candidatus Paceibacterota bacterium]|jgi:ArsR family transcriptional regulator
MKNTDLEKSLKAVANGRRLDILRLLKEHSKLTVGDLAKKIKLSFKSTSRHLAILFAAGILDKEQKNLNVFYRISGEANVIIKSIVQNL